MAEEGDKDKFNLTIEYEIIVKDKDGKVIEHRKNRSKSLVKNFLMLLNAGYKVSTSSVVDTGGITRSASAKYSVSYHVSLGAGYTRTLSGPGGWAASAAEGDATFGIIVGTGTTPVSVTDYKLASKIAHGNGAGQLYHYSTVISDPTINGLGVEQKFTRLFINNSGDPITINEIGFVVKTSVDLFLTMIIRDIITSPVIIPHNNSCSIEYSIKTG
jgi:hypothetical protein